MRPYIIGGGRQRTKRKGKRKESQKIRNLRPYIIGRGWGPHPAAADQKKRKERKESPKIRNLRPYIIGGGQQRAKRKGKRKESPKIRNLRPYIIGRGWGPHPAAADQKRRKEKGKPQNQKFEALYNRGGQQRTKRKGKRKESLKIRNLRPYIVGRGWGPHPAAERERKAQKSEI